MERVIRTVIIMAAVCAFLLLGTCSSAAAQKPVQISTYQQLTTFIDGINDGSISAEQDAILTKDITVPASLGNGWVPLAKDPEHAYQGTFDGDGHTIHGIRVERNEGQDMYPKKWDHVTPVYDHTAFISYLGAKGSVKELNVKADFSDINDVAGIVSVNAGMITDCTFQGTLRSEIYPDNEFTDFDSCAGGIAAENAGNIENCRVLAGSNIIRGGLNAGGIAGTQTTGGVIRGCENEASILTRETIYEVDAIYVGCGGILGEQAPYFQNAGGNNSTADEDDQPLVENCINNGDLSVEQASGGICAVSMGSIIKNCVNNGKIKVIGGGKIGGIVGHVTAYNGSPAEVTGCVNTGDIGEKADFGQNGSYIGGIAGWATDEYGYVEEHIPMKLSNCKNTGDIFGQEMVGGVIGKVENGMYDVNGHMETYVYQLVNLGRVDGETYVGGIAGSCPGVIADTINYGSVNAVPGEESKEEGCLIGGIAGTAGVSGRISNSYNMGSISVLALGDIPYLAGGITSSTEDALPGCYMCMETSGEVNSLTADDRSNPRGLLTLQEMTGDAAAGAMADMMGAYSGDHYGTVWHTMTDAAKAGKTYVMTPQFEGVSFSIDEIIASGVDLEKKNLTDLAGSVVTLAETTYVYTGEAYLPEVVSVVSGQTPLTIGTDYVIYGAYNNEMAGIGEVIVLGRGDYCGFAKADFTLIPAKAGIKSLKAGKKKLTVTLTGKPAKCGATKYKIQYRIKGKASWKTVTTSKAKVTIKKLKKGKKYQVRARAYTIAGEETLCGAWSKVKTSKKIR